MNRSRLKALIAILAFACNALAVRAADFAPGLEPTLVKDAVHAIQIATEWLEANQNADGYWGRPEYPALSALAVSSILRSPDHAGKPNQPDSVKRALAYIATKAQPDGSIYHVPGETKGGGGIASYNTAICLMALDDANDKAYTEKITKARQWLISAQYLGDGPFNGGMGYDIATNRLHADLSNTVFALEALKRSEPIEKAGADAKDLDWDAAIAFLSRCQHLKATNKEPWVQDRPEEVGGFVYEPGDSKAGNVSVNDQSTSSTKPNSYGSIEGTPLTYPRSYGSMTYAGLMSMLYADVKKEDQRITAAAAWLRANWTLDENPRMGAEGLYYGYHTLAKALDALGEEQFKTDKGETVSWRNALIRKLVSLQKIDPKTGLGYWQNENNRWWENDPNLATCYTILALETALGTDPGAYPKRIASAK